MRTNIILDDKLVNEAKRLTGLSTKREVVEAGLKELVRLRRQADVRKWRGRLRWDGDLGAMRTGRR